MSVFQKLKKTTSNSLISHPQVQERGSQFGFVDLFDESKELLWFDLLDEHKHVIDEHNIE